MLLSLLKLILGVVLVLLPFILTTNKLRHLLENLLPKAKEFIKVSVIVLYWIILEVIGLHLIIDPIIPGQGTIYVHAAKTGAGYPFAMRNLTIEIAPLNFDGHVDYSRLRSGAFTQTGVYSSLVNFDWGEHRVFIRVYDRSQSDRSIIEDYKSISPYVRIGLWDEHVYLDDRTSN